MIGRVDIDYNADDADVADVESPEVPLKNPEGYTDYTAYRALKNVMQPETVWRDPPDHRHWRLIKTLMNLIDLMDYDLLNRIELYDRKSGRTYR